jgi:hypothetical protein
MTPDQAAALQAILREPSYEETLVPDLVLEAAWLATQADRARDGTVTIAASSAARIARIMAFIADEIRRETRPT